MPVKRSTSLLLGIWERLQVWTATLCIDGCLSCNCSGLGYMNSTLMSVPAGTVMIGLLCCPDHRPFVCASSSEQECVFDGRITLACIIKHLARVHITHAVGDSHAPAIPPSGKALALRRRVILLVQPWHLGFSLQQRSAFRPFSTARPRKPSALTRWSELRLE